jgi:hypothetical protein
MPAHFPEAGFETGGFLEDHDQLCLAGWRGIEFSEILQLRSAATLVWFLLFRT